MLRSIAPHHIALEMNGIVGAKYDAFLSFRGPDTRDGFTDHLYESMFAAGIRVFKDDEGIRRGEDIGGEIKRAILDSRIYVIVLSRNYASSSWCLRELTMILDCCGDPASAKVVLPIFYDVDPDDVKLRTELYREALVKHEERYGLNIARKWEEALAKVGQISGWDLKEIQGEGKFVRIIIQDILGKLKIRDRRLPEHLTGIDNQVDKFMKLLCLESPDVRVVLVHGMGGIGKTTLAGVVFNRISSQFEGCSFLSNVRESSTSEKGIKKLQKKLLTDILGIQHVKVSDSSDGFNEIRRRLQGRSVLIVFDDVDERDQFGTFVGNCDWFGPGTRIVITTRDRSIGRHLMNVKVVYAFEMKEMKDDHALQLFSRHAFGGDRIPEDYVTLSKQVVQTTGNLPLALEVIGGHLSSESEEVWEGTLEKLRQVPDKKVMKVLLVSYEGLDDREKQIFLDIACFSGEMPRRYANYMWEACNFYPKCGLAILINKSLVKILPNDEFWMHDQLRDIGRDIVRLEGVSRFGYCSRLWVPEDALQVMHRKEGTDNILAVNLGVLPEGKSFTREEFRCMSNLRYLQLNGGRFIGDFESFRTKLLWLSWENCPTGLPPTFFSMNKLVVLRISGPGITDDSVGKLMLASLRVLQIHHAPMTVTPDFSRCLKLEIIILEDCCSLKTVHSSIGKLGGLATLKVCWCASLTGLPEELGCAKALQELFVAYCGTDQRRFDLPKSINVLASLEILHVYYGPIQELPDSSLKLKSLKFLFLKNCNIKSLPDQFFCLKSLIEMDLSNNEIEELPESIGMLESLKILCVRNTKIRKLPYTIGNLSRLIELDAACCPLNEGIPEQFGALSALAKLDFKNSELRELPTSFSQLSSLRSLGLQNCSRLQELPELPTSLTKLKYTSESLQRLPDLSPLTDLKNLQFCDSYAWSSFFKRVPDGTRSDGQSIQLSWIGNLHKLQTLHLHFTRVSAILPTDLSSLSELKKLYLSCPDMKSLLQLPSCLLRLSISYFKTTIPWMHYSNLRLLHSLELHHSSLMEIQLGGLELLENLKVLRIADCTKLVSLPGLAGLTRLSSLKLETCPVLVEIPGLGQMEMLEHLAFLSCESIASMPDLQELRRMKDLGISFCDSLCHIPRMISDCSLRIHSCRWLHDFYGPYWQYQPRRTPGLI